jgi:hypothetical protein
MTPFAGSLMNAHVTKIGILSPAQYYPRDKNNNNIRIHELSNRLVMIVNMVGQKERQYIHIKIYGGHMAIYE